MDLSTPLYKVVGIGPTYAKKLERLNLFTAENLINHFPFRYDDFTQTKSILESQIGEKVTLQGEVWSIKNIYTRSRKILTQAIFNDGTSPITLTWFNQSWLTKQIQVGDKLQISGKVSKYKTKLSIVSPVWEKISISNEQSPINNSPLHTGRLVPVYPETFGLTSKWIRTKISQLLPVTLDQLTDPLPEEIKGQMIDLTEAISQIHFPEDYKKLQQARDRLSFDELFYIQLATQKTRLEWKNKPLVKPLNIAKEKLQIFIKKLPFKLTKAQQKVIGEILEDLKKEQPMNRLVQGEVGSGKTVVAAIIAYLVHLNGLKTLLMAPTEILSEQHFQNFARWLSPLGISVALLLGRQTASEQREIKARLASGEIHLIIGTHALFQSDVEFKNLALLMIDEQHRFGVHQRLALMKKGLKTGYFPHQLIMTATPIPRTLAMTAYADLDFSVIDELPPGRKPISTILISSSRRDEVIDRVRVNCESKKQAYWVCTLIDESEMLQCQAAETTAAQLREQLPTLKIGLIHGRLKSGDKNAVMEKFVAGEIDLLVATTVIEVGVDVANASLMIIENPERLGLSQLHQLRGRVGRGDVASFCVLLYQHPLSDVAKQRLSVMRETQDGFVIAEQDLQMRGPGDVLGVRQSGLMQLRVADLIRDQHLLSVVQTAGKQLIDNHPELIAKIAARWVGAQAQYLAV